MKKVVLITILFFIIPAFVLADSINVVNTGTNVITDVITDVDTSGGGESKSSVKVYTEINGEVVEDFEQEIMGDEKFEYKAEKEIDGNKLKTKVEINTQNQSNESDPGITLLEGSKNKEETFKERARLNDIVGQVKKIFKYVFSWFKF